MDGRAPDAYRQSSTPRRMRPTARNLRARPTIVRRGPRALGAAARRPPRARGPPCGAALDARCTGARSGRAPVHRAQAAVHVPCNAVRPRLAPGALLRRTRVLLPGPLSHAWWGCQGTRAPRTPRVLARTGGAGQRPRLAPSQSWGAPEISASSLSPARRLPYCACASIDTIRTTLTRLYVVVDF